MQIGAAFSSPPCIQQEQQEGIYLLCHGWTGPE
jgi:hypothetical protein